MRHRCLYRHERDAGRALRFHVFTFPISDGTLQILLRKGDTELRDQIDSTLLRPHGSGTLAELQEKWFGYPMDLPTEHVEPIE